MLSFGLPILLPLALFFFLSHGLTNSPNAFGNENGPNGTDPSEIEPMKILRGESADEFDPMVDDVIALLTEEGGENGTTVGITVEGDEEEEQQLLLRCADQLSTFVPLLIMLPHYHSWDFSCHFQGNQSEIPADVPTKNANVNAETFWKMSKPCRSIESFRLVITSQPNCHLFIGFVDHLHTFPKGTLITKLSGNTLEGKEAVVRLVCGEEMKQFNEEKRNKKETLKMDGDEETFLKTLVVVEKTWLPGCIAVFFDSRTLTPLDYMHNLLWKGEEPKLGTTDGNNKWAASKFVCGEEERGKFYEQLKKMKVRNEQMGQGILIFENGESEVRNVLLQKSDEELYCSEKVEKGFLQRLWDGLFG